jgi:PAS domain S-box-containing protein
VSKPIKVLIVEDSEDDALLEMLALRRGGFAPTWRRVQDAQSLKDAIAQERWDVVLSDFRLPNFGGVEALQIFRASGLDIPFIFVSGTIGEETAVKAMKAGASDYVMKQSTARLAAVVQRELEQAVIRAQHRQAQIELELSRDRYVDLYDFAPVGYLTLSDLGCIEQINLTGAELLGDSRDSLLGQRFTRFVEAQESERWFEHFMKALHDGQKLRLELSMQRSDGSRFDAQLDCRRVQDRAASPMVRVAMIDISDRKEAEAGRREYEAQMRHMQKMESVGTLAGGIAHDFNNILGAILGNVQLAREEVGPGHPAQGSLEEIERASMRARNLVRQILTFSRHEPQQSVVQPLVPIIEETRKLLRATLPAGVDLDVRLDNAPLNVQADATQLQQVLMNLCTNAWHALKASGGRIRVGVRGVAVDAPRAAKVGLPAAGVYAHVWVRDNGCGMDAATRERIFEPFFTTKPVGQGTGLGLSVVHGIVRAHGGAIEVESAPGRGSCFHLYFPLVQQAAAPPPAVPAAPAGSIGHGEVVAYVDDDETMVLMVTRLLEKFGYRAIGYRDADEMLDILRCDNLVLACLITDFNMPGRSGLEVARETARLRPGLPIIISSGYITEELQKAAQREGVCALLEKQNTFEELGSILSRVLAGRVVAQ